jgi:hypothetical protein
MQHEDDETTEDNLVDYNEDPQYNNILENPNETETESSHSPSSSPMALQEEQDQDMGDSQDEKSETHSELTARAELQLAKQDALSDMLNENGFKLRQRISRDNVQASITVPMAAPTRPIVEVLSLIP